MRKQAIHILFLALALLLAACGTARHRVVESTAARAADAMAHLKSKPLYRFITEWTGVRYQLGGLDKKGIDCSGFAFILEKEIYGVTLPRRSKDQAALVKEKRPGNLQEGDLIFFSFEGNEVDHVGVYLNNDFFVHASTSRGVIVDDLNLPAYKRTLVKGGTAKPAR